MRDNSAGRLEPAVAGANGSAALATELVTREFGQGDSAVRAVNEVSIQIGRGSSLRWWVAPGRAKPRC